MPRPKDTINVFVEKTCRKCGKVFLPAIEHRYKEAGRYYCSWTCYLHRNDDKGLKAGAITKEEENDAI